MIGGIGNMLFSINSQTENAQDPRVSLVNLWGQVITLRGQILVSRTGDATLNVLWLCVVRFCVLLVCRVCVGVCVCVLVLVLVLVLVCHADPSPLLFPLPTPPPHHHPPPPTPPLHPPTTTTRLEQVCVAFLCGPQGESGC